MTNYDFKSNWEQRIMPLLKTERIQKAIKKGIMAWLSSEKERIIENELTQEEKRMTGKAKTELYKSKRKYYDLHDKRFTDLKYDKNKLPYRYAKGSCRCMFYEDEEKIEEKLIEWGILKADPNKPKKSEYKDIEEYEEANDDYQSGETGEQYYNYKEEIIEPYFRANAEKSYKSYCVYGACFWYNTTFCLELARMVIPNEVWKIKKSNIHATIINEKENCVFDILYYDEDDETFGGRHALTDVNNKISWDKYTQLQDKLLNSMPEQKNGTTLNINSINI